MKFFNRKKVKDSSYKAVEYGVLTSYELSSFIHYFQTDLEELFWAIEHLVGHEKIKKLERYKIEYLDRFKKAESNSTSSHVYSKVQEFIDSEIYKTKAIEEMENVIQPLLNKMSELQNNMNLSGNDIRSNENVIKMNRFLDFFKSKEEGANILSLLIESNHLEGTIEDYRWKNQSHGQVKTFVKFIKYLDYRSLLCPEYYSLSKKEVAMVLCREFKFKFSERNLNFINDMSKEDIQEFEFLGPLIS